MRPFLVLALLVAAACQAAPQGVAPVPAGASRADGIVTMESAGTLWNPVTADWRDAQAAADGRCRAWGHAGAASYAGWQEACRQYDLHGRCVRTLVTRFYPCAG